MLELWGGSRWIPAPLINFWICYVLDLLGCRGNLVKVVGREITRESREEPPESLFTTRALIISWKYLASTNMPLSTYLFYVLTIHRLAWPDLSLWLLSQRLGTSLSPPNAVAIRWSWANLFCMLQFCCPKWRPIRPHWQSTIGCLNPWSRRVASI